MHHNAKITRTCAALSAATLFLAGVVACSGTDEGEPDGSDDENGGSGGTASSGGSPGNIPGTGGNSPGAGGSASCNDDLCGNTCVDLTTSAEHCGSCNNACESYEACQESTCVRVSCDEPLTLCGGACPHPLFDRAHCGACDTPCDSDEACVGGDCSTIAIPGNEYCSATSDWALDRTAREFEILDLVNRHRAEGADCGARGYFEPAPPLQMEASLRCAARKHSHDMMDRNFFSHSSPDPGGTGPGARLTAAGYSGQGWGENIAAGRSTAALTMEQWMNSDGHCANIMNPNFTLLGVGYAPNDGGADYGHYWTQTFGR